MPAEHPDYIRAIRQIDRTPLGRKYDRMARSKYGISGKKLAAKELKGESGFRMGAVSSAGARGATQFMPSTRAEYIQRYGVDAWKNRKSAVKAMELYQTAGHGIASYNPGMPSYTSYILGQKLSPGDRRALSSGKAVRSGGSGTRAKPGSGFTLQGPSSTSVALKTHTIPGQSFEAQRQALTEGLFLSGQKLNMQSLLDYKSQLDSLKDVPSRTSYDGLKVTHQQGAPVHVRGRSTAGAAPASSQPTPHGRVKVASTANRAGVGIVPEVLRFDRALAGRLGHPVVVGTGTNHSRMTVDGNVSDHWDGHATDIPASGAKLTHMGQQALILAGMPRHKALQQHGGLFNLYKGGKRIQIIFNTNEGGNHYNHLHVGVR